MVGLAFGRVRAGVTKAGSRWSPPDLDQSAQNRGVRRIAGRRAQLGIKDPDFPLNS